MRSINSLVRLSWKYLSYRLKALDAHGIHSPFVYNFYQTVIKNRTEHPDFLAAEAVRNQFIISTEQIKVTDLGAGSTIQNSPLRKVSDIARYSSKNKKLGVLLYRIVEFYKPEYVLDIGSSLGITTVYQTLPVKTSKIYSFEGCPETARLARENFKKLHLNTRLIEGNLNETLGKTVSEIPKIDYVFFDANHQLEPTLNYFQICLNKSHQDSIFIFDDIHYSKQMEKAWQQIKSHPEVMITIDLFYVGIVLFRKNQPKQHFVLKF